MHLRAMRCLALLLTALAFKASADTSVNSLNGMQTKSAALPKKDTKEESDAKVLNAAAAPERQASMPALPAAAPAAAAVPAMTPAPTPGVFSPTTKPPWQRYVGPAVGATLGAAALAGVIAVSAMKNPTTTPMGAAAMPKINGKEGALPPVKVGDGFLAGGNDKGTTAAPIEGGTTTMPTVSSGMTQSTVLAVACGLVACGLIAICIVGIISCCAGKKKRGRKPPTRETPGVVPEDEQPMMGTRIDVAQTAPDLNESQYMPVLPPLNPGSGYAGGVGIGSIPTMANVVPMQTMPPPPPPPLGYSQPAGLNLSVYQQASPLANTVNALPTTAFSNMQAPPTYFG